jgi:hypothetical protein
MRSQLFVQKLLVWKDINRSISELWNFLDGEGRKQHFHIIIDQAWIYISVMSEALHFSLETYTLQRSVAERDFCVETENHSWFLYDLILITDCPVDLCFMHSQVTEFVHALTTKNVQTLQYLQMASCDTLYIIKKFTKVRSENCNPSNYNYYTS